MKSHFYLLPSLLILNFAAAIPADLPKVGSLVLKTNNKNIQGAFSNNEDQIDFNIYPVLKTDLIADATSTGESFKENVDIKETDINLNTRKSLNSALLFKTLLLKLVEVIFDKISTNTPIDILDIINEDLKFIDLGGDVRVKRETDEIEIPILGAILSGNGDATVKSIIDYFGLSNAVEIFKLQNKPASKSPATKAKGKHADSNNSKKEHLEDIDQATAQVNTKM